MTTVIGYAVLAIGLEDAAIAAELYAILEPFGDEVAFSGATSQGPVSAYLGKLASVTAHHEDADAHLLRALEITRAFGWEYHEATTLVALALSQRRRTGSLDDEARRRGSTPPRPSPRRGACAGSGLRSSPFGARRCDGRSSTA